MLTDFFEAFRRVNRTPAADGYGGTTFTYTDGTAFQAGIITQKQKESEIANRAGQKVNYTLIVKPNIRLVQNDIVKRVKDGRYYRITSDTADRTTPAVAYVKYAQADAEIIDIDSDGLAVSS